MQTGARKNLTLGLVAGISLIALTGVLMGQGVSQPAKSETQYFVTADSDEAHHWVREGAAIRVIGDGECKECRDKVHDHKKGDGHDHAKEAPTKK